MVGAALIAGLPLLVATPRRWAEIAAADLTTFLADHAVCEQQAALAALSLVGWYPEDDVLVERMTAIAAEEISHFRRVAGMLRSRGHRPARRRPNPWVRGLHQRIEQDRGPERKVDRLLVGALIEARSCERFSLLHEVVDDPEVESLLADLGPAERRHWRVFHDLARREIPTTAFERRWRRWLEVERDLSEKTGLRPTVHG